MIRRPIGRFSFSCPFHSLYSFMAYRKTSIDSSRVDSNALSSFGDMEALTLVGTAAAATTLGGAVFIGAAVAPAQVLGGLAIAGTCVGVGQVKASTGSYLPFLKKDDEKAEAPAAA